MTRRLILVVPLLALYAPHARAEDAEGCKDSPVVQRIPGSSINSCDHKDYDQAEVLGDAAGTGKEIEGEVSRITYTVPEKMTSVQVTKNYANALTKAGYRLVFQDDSRTVGQLKDKSREQWVYINDWNHPGLEVTIVAFKPMKQLVEVTAQPAASAAGRSMAGDKEGCKDSPMVRRFPGSVLTDCDSKDFDRVALPGKEPPEEVEGAVERRQYQVPEGASPFQVVMNYANALTRAGFTIVEPQAMVVGSLTASGQAWWIWVNAWNHPGLEMTIIHKKEMEQLVKVSADVLLSELKAHGRVSVYGINFDTGKDTIWPESEAILKEVERMLEGTPDLKLKIEGHTDNVGSPAVNLPLSARRAEAVKRWLTGKGITAGRLTTQGFGDTKPVADNASEAGRAKNRRVELVKR
jgi:OmpA-OmpF porin, OOP family